MLVLNSKLDQAVIETAKAFDCTELPKGLIKIGVGNNNMELLFESSEQAATAGKEMANDEEVRVNVSSHPEILSVTVKPVFGSKYNSQEMNELAARALAHVTGVPLIDNFDLLAEMNDKAFNEIVKSRDMEFEKRHAEMKARREARTKEFDAEYNKVKAEIEAFSANVEARAKEWFNR